MKKNVTLEQAMPLMEEMLSCGSEVSFVPSGTSMIPLIYGGRDAITLKKPSSTLKKYDIPLYRRQDGSYVLHRIIDVKKDGYVMCGDHQSAKEYPISHESIIAVMVSLERNGKHIDCSDTGYKIYSRIWTFIRPLRPMIFYAVSLVSRIFKKGK